MTEHDAKELAEQIEGLLANPLRFFRECGEERRPWHLALFKIAKLVVDERNLRTKYEAGRRAADLVEREVVQLKLQIVELKRALEVLAIREERAGRA